MGLKGPKNVRETVEEEFSSLGSDQVNEVFGRGVTQVSGGQDPGNQSSGPGGSQPDGGNSFYADFVSGIDRSGFDPMRSAAEDDIMNGVRDMSILQGYRAADTPVASPAQPGVLPANTYYPGIGENIVKGYVGGKYPIVTAGGGLMPMGVFDARRQVLTRSAQREQSRRQAKEAEAKRFDAYDPVEQDINNIYWNRANQIKNEAFKKYGRHAPDMLADPNTSEYQSLERLNQQLETLSEFTNTVYGQMDEKMKDVVDGKQFATPESRAVMEQYRTGINEVIRSVGPNSTEQDLQKVNKVLASYMAASQSAISMNSVYDRFFDSHIKPDMIETMPDLYEALETGDRSVITTKSTEYLKPDRLDTFADQIWAEHEYDIKLSRPGMSDEEHKKQIKKEIAARFANRSNVSYSTIRKKSTAGPGSSTLSNKDFYVVQSDPANISPLAANKYDRGFLFGANNSRDLQDVPVVLDSKVYYEDETDKKWAGEPNRKIYMDIDGIMYGDQETASGTKISGWYLFGTTEYEQTSTGMKKGDRVKSISVPLSLDKYDASLGIVSGDMVLSSIERHTGFTKRELQRMLSDSSVEAPFSRPDQTPVVNTQEEYDKLPSGTKFIDSEGNEAIKP